MTTPPSPRSTAYHLPVLLFVASVCLVLGLSVPIIEVRNFLFFSGSYSIVEAVWLLLEEGDYLVGVIVAAFSILLPAVKIGALLVMWLMMWRGRSPSRRLPALIDSIGKWSMLDVLVIALVVFAAKASAFVDAEVAWAILPFMASIALTIYCARAIKHRLDAVESGPDPA